MIAVETFSPRNEEIIAKHMPKFAVLENKRLAKVSQSDIGKPFKSNGNGGRKPKDVPSKERNEAIFMFKAGIPSYKIREQLKLSKHALSLVLCQAGLRQFPVEMLPKKARYIRSQMSRGKNNLQIAKEIGISESAVEHWIARFGLDQW